MQSGRRRRRWARCGRRWANRLGLGLRLRCGRQLGRDRQRDRQRHGFAQLLAVGRFALDQARRIGVARIDAQVEPGKPFGLGVLEHHFDAALARVRKRIAPQSLRDVLLDDRSRRAAACAIGANDLQPIGRVLRQRDARRGEQEPCAETNQRAPIRPDA